MGAEFSPLLTIALIAAAAVIAFALRREPAEAQPLSEEPQIDALSSRALDLERQGDLGEAIEVFREISRQASDPSVKSHAEASIVRLAPRQSAFERELLDQDDDERSAPVVDPQISTRHTIIPRYMAASLDGLAAILAGILIAQAIGEQYPILQISALIVVYLSYFFLLEGLLGRTPAKFMAGLIIVQYDGRRCTWRQAFVRTAFRLLEVNPVLLGGLPAGLCIITSEHHQRIGDRIARTVVVRNSHIPKAAR